MPNMRRENDDEEDDEPMEALDTETLAILNKAKQTASLKSPDMGVQSPANAGVTPSHLNEEHPQEEHLKLNVFWKGPPRDNFPPKWRFQFQLVRSYPPLKV